MYERIYKTWGQRHRIFEDSSCEVCYLDLEPYQRCSYHFHNTKSNLFFVITGELTVKTEWGTVVIGPNELFTVHPQDNHEFQTGMAPTRVIEVAYVFLDPQDIYRGKLGGPTKDEVGDYEQTR